MGKNKRTDKKVPVSKGRDALRAERQAKQGAEVEIDQLMIRLKIYGLRLDEFVMLTPTAARVLFEDGLAKVRLIEESTAAVARRHGVTNV